MYYSVAQGYIESTNNSLDLIDLDLAYSDEVGCILFQVPRFYAVSSKTRFEQALHIDEHMVIKYFIPFSFISCRHYALLQMPLVHSMPHCLVVFIEFVNPFKIRRV
jgi:hypothetical protein